MQQPLLPDPQCIAQAHLPGPVDCSTLLGHLEQAVHRIWHSNYRISQIHSHWVIQQNIGRPAQRPPRHWEDAATHPSNSLLDWHWCRLSQLCDKMYPCALSTKQPSLCSHASLRYSWRLIARHNSSYFTNQGKEYLFICNTFSRYQFIYRSSL